MLAGLFGDINGAAHEFSDVPRPTVNICPQLVEKLPRFFNALNAPYSNRLTFMAYTTRSWKTGLITLLATSYVVGKPSRRMGGTPVRPKYAPVLSERRGWLIILANARSLSANSHDRGAVGGGMQPWDWDADARTGCEGASGRYYPTKR
ncbi:hypothetical protein M0657_012160 [Pyricularia oryzae]|nr:hypothetical protein M0657_012160 [Pyricularia oryzae]KAI7909256.1 hypothetical protein M9X92_011732 [Pyricularia oryzae]